MSDRWHCQHCGHWHGGQKCQAITHNETGGAQRCSCTGHQESGD